MPARSQTIRQRTRHYEERNWRFTVLKMKGSSWCQSVFFIIIIFYFFSCHKGIAVNGLELSLWYFRLGSSLGWKVVLGQVGCLVGSSLYPLPALPTNKVTIKRKMLLDPSSWGRGWVGWEVLSHLLVGLKWISLLAKINHFSKFVVQELGLHTWRYSLIERKNGEGKC